MEDNPHLNILVQLAKIDGDTDDAELELIRQIGISSNVDPDDIDAIIAKTAAEDTIPSLEHLTKEEKIELMANLVLVMKIDGRIHKEEMKFCLKVLKKLGYEEDALFDLVSTTLVDPEMEITKEDIQRRAELYLKLK
ncbi:hypothetical protein GCM10009122_57990 [Fulvivirga kasyanovii]|uniref:TerB family tellurite resistance protein n=1 Tax=Fulvivirga kasyanovii TaxID=396812 RepID=A0ABW9RSX9_9BACT|nr:TerB family tellurite resistance protein [Fulvivirga kasyanovii]MTI26404.1 hypothetical protein [Fulvivirga kasyanovii]